MRKRNFKNKTSKLKKYKGGASSISYDELDKMKELFKIIATKKISSNEIKAINDLLNENELLKENISEIIDIIETIQINRANPNDEPKINIAIDELSQHVQNLATRKYKSRGARVGSIIGEVAGHGTQVAAVGVGKATARAGRAIGSGFRNIFGRGRGTAKSGISSGASAANGHIEVSRGADGELENSLASSRSLLKGRLNNQTSKNDKRQAIPTSLRITSGPTLASGNGALTAASVPPPALANAAAANAGIEGNVDLALTATPAVPATVAANANAGGNVAVVPPPAPPAPPASTTATAVVVPSATGAPAPPPASRPTPVPDKYRHNKDNPAGATASKRKGSRSLKIRANMGETLKNRRTHMELTGAFNAQKAEKISAGIKGTKPGANI